VPASKKLSFFKKPDNGQSPKKKIVLKKLDDGQSPKKKIVSVNFSHFVFSLIYTWQIGDASLGLAPYGPVQRVIREFKTASHI
jgi:hypothetical protein